MENASKALIIAAEILLGIMVLTLMIYVFGSFGRFSADINEKIDRAQITEFNDHFLTYENRDNITATEIVTVINFAKQANDSRELKRNDSSVFYIRVYVDGNDFFDDLNDDDYNNNLNMNLNDFLKNNNTDYFTCEGFEYGDKTELINGIYFTKTN